MSVAAISPWNSPRSFTPWVPTALLVRKDQVLRSFDAMLREQLMARLREDGITVLTQTQVGAVARRVSGSLSLHCDGQANVLNIDTLLWAIGAIRILTRSICQRRDWL